MTQPRKGAEYGLPFLYNAITIGDPRSAESFEQHNRLCDDVAQMTRVAARAWVVFPLTLANGAVSSGVAGKSQMGTAGSSLPTVTRTAAGRYRIVYPGSWTDGAGVDTTGVGQTETISLVAAWGNIQSDTAFGRVQCRTANQTIYVSVVQNVAGADTATDLSVAVSGAANNGSGAVRLAVSSTTTLIDGATAIVAGITGTGGLPAAANGTWVIHVIDGTHVDLLSSAFAGAYSAGGAITTGALCYVECRS